MTFETIVKLLAGGSKQVIATYEKGMKKHVQAVRVVKRK
jgi:hypothetical protein